MLAAVVSMISPNVCDRWLILQHGHPDGGKRAEIALGFLERGLRQHGRASAEIEYACGAHVACTRHVGRVHGQMR